MKAIGRLLGLVSVIVILFSTAVIAAPRLYSLSVEGLVCPVCAFSVKRNLGAIDGVHDVKIDFRSGKALVTMLEGATLAEAEARTAIESAGFKLRSFEERPNTQ